MRRVCEGYTFQKFEPAVNIVQFYIRIYLEAQNLNEEWTHAGVIANHFEKTMSGSYFFLSC